MSRLHSRKSLEICDYATADEFETLFQCEQAALLRLAILLTANAENAQICVIRAVRDCMSNGSVSREWMRTWARRAVIRNAVRLVREANELLRSRIQDEPGSQIDYSSPTQSPLPAILALSEFERLVFVICILERYAIQDCALLLARSPKEVHDALARATDQIATFEQPHLQGSSTFRKRPYSVYSNIAGESDDYNSCGTLLN